MTTHTFPAVPSEVHNDQHFYFCVTCNAAKIVKAPVTFMHGMVYWPYSVPIDAEKFPTCEAAFAEAERQKVEAERREKERLAERAERQERAAAFFANHAENAFYWVRVDGKLTIAQLFRSYDLPKWHCLVGDDDDDGYVFPLFDAVEIVSGPIEGPT
jgi:hypothetical protein